MINWIITSTYVILTRDCGSRRQGYECYSHAFVFTIRLSPEFAKSRFEGRGGSPEPLEQKHSLDPPDSPGFLLQFLTRGSAFPIDNVMTVALGYQGDEKDHSHPVEKVSLSFTRILVAFVREGMKSRQGLI